MFVPAVDNIVNNFVDSFTASFGDTAKYYAYMVYLKSKPVLIVIGIVSFFIAAFVLIAVRREKEIQQKAILFCVISILLCFSLYYGVPIFLTEFAPITG